MSESRKPTVLVVGAGDFIGAEISKRFAKGGYRCVWADAMAIN